MYIIHEGTVVAYVVSLHDVPTQIETYKSHNHVHMIKNGDIGQALMLHSLVYNDSQSQEHVLQSSMATLIQMESIGSLPEAISCGLTPPMIEPYVLLHMFLERVITRRLVMTDASVNA